MTRIAVRPLTPGSADADAVASGMAINFPAAFLKALNIIPWKRGEIRDRHHDLFRTNVTNKSLVFPTCVGSTYTGLVLLELIKTGHAPAVIIVSLADPLLVSGCILAQVWYDLTLPVLEVEQEDDLGHIATGDHVRYREGDPFVDLMPSTEKT